MFVETELYNGGMSVLLEKSVAFVDVLLEPGNSRH